MAILTLINDNTSVTVGAESCASNKRKNELVLKFKDDSFARVSEAILKKNNFLTKHDDSTITILNASDIDFRFN